MVVLLSLLQLLTAMLLTFTPSSFAIPYYHTKCSKNAQVEYHTTPIKVSITPWLRTYFQTPRFRVGLLFCK